MLLGLVVRAVCLWICFNGLSNKEKEETSLMQLFFPLQWFRKPLSSLWRSPGLVCPKHCLESAGCSPSYGRKSLLLRRLCWMPTGSSIWARTGIRRGMGHPIQRAFLALFPPLHFPSFGELLETEYRQKEKSKLPCFMLSWNVRFVSTSEDVFSLNCY